MAQGIIAGFYFEGMAVDKTTLEAEMDRIGFEMIQAIGGAPWVLVQDDSNRVQSPNVIRDDQGFQYQGARKYIFKGPLVELPTESYHDAYKPQGVAY